MKRVHLFFFLYLHLSVAGIIRGDNYPAKQILGGSTLDFDGGCCRDSFLINFFFALGIY